MAPFSTESVAPSGTEANGRTLSGVPPTYLLAVTVPEAPSEMETTDFDAAYVLPATAEKATYRKFVAEAVPDTSVRATVPPPIALLAASTSSGGTSSLAPFATRIVFGNRPSREIQRLLR